MKANIIGICAQTLHLILLHSVYTSSVVCMQSLSHQSFSLHLTSLTNRCDPTCAKTLHLTCLQPAAACIHMHIITAIKPSPTRTAFRARSGLHCYASNAIETIQRSISILALGANAQNLLHLHCVTLPNRRAGSGGVFGCFGERWILGDTRVRLCTACKCLLKCRYLIIFRMRSHQSPAMTRIVLDTLRTFW